MNKFFEEFQEKTNGEFNMLKYKSATYFKVKKELIIRLIITNKKLKDFDDAQKAKVQSVVDNMFLGLKVVLDYVRTFADENVVKNKLLEFYNANNQIVFRTLTNDFATIFVNEDEIEINMTFDTPFYKLITASDNEQKLFDFMNTSFNEEIIINIKENVVNITKDSVIKGIQVETVLVGDSSLRLVEAQVGEKIFAKAKIAGVTRLPNYIVDIKTPNDNVVLCGKISNIEKRLYKNKRFDPTKKSSGHPELPLVRFMIDDSSDKIEGVCFPTFDAAQSIVELDDRTEVICIGSVGLSSYNNALSFTVNAMFYANINFESIHLKKVMPVPNSYKTIIPEKFAIMSQESLFDQHDDVPEFLRDKTFVIYDLEATDRFPETAEIIEIAALKVVNGKEVETFQSLIKPNVHIPDRIIEITHIDNEMVYDSPDIMSVLPDFFKFSRDSILVGHNINSYDFPLLSKYAKVEGYNFDNELVDTLILARKYLTEMKKFNLELLAKTFNVAHENAHRAMSDVMATFEILKIIAKRMN